MVISIPGVGGIILFSFIFFSTLMASLITLFLPRFVQYFCRDMTGGKSTIFQKDAVLIGLDFQRKFLQFSV